MGVAERKEREKKALKERIVKTASKMFVEHGFEKTSIRKIAEAIDYSPGTIYLYFKDKNELFYEIHARAFKLFLSEFEKVAKIKNPVERLEKLGEAYVDFGLNNPEYYDAMFIMRAPMDTIHTEENWELGMQSHQVLVLTISECMQKGIIPEQGCRSLRLSFLVYGSRYGFALQSRAM